MIKEVHKVIIVEGTSDKRHIEPLFKEAVDIVCTHGTLGVEKLDALVEQLEMMDVYILVDADDSGRKLANQLVRELPNAKMLRIPRMYKEVEKTPKFELIKILADAHFLLA